MKHSPFSIIKICFFLLLLGLFPNVPLSATLPYPFWDPSLPIELRINDLTLSADNLLPGDSIRAILPFTNTGSVGCDEVAQCSSLIPVFRLQKG